MTVDPALDEEFFRLTEPYRRELMSHCYRMMGSHHDAEDLLQETIVRAWRGYGRFDGRSSLRTWLHRIANNACLNALESTQRRPLPSGLGADPADPLGVLERNAEVPWLEPGRVDGSDADPSAVVTGRESVRLAFVAALQFLPPRQRAVLVLRDVFAWRAQEVADAVGVTTATVNSLLQRARAAIAERRGDAGELADPDAPEARALLDRYVAAFQEYDLAELERLFTADAVWEMPPFTGWYRGPQAITRLIGDKCPARGAGDMVLRPVVANGCAAFGLYMRDPDDGVHRAFQLQVVDVTAAGVGHVVAFFDTTLFAGFGLPESL